MPEPARLRRLMRRLNAETGAGFDGAPISDFEAMSYYVIVATAGHDTTSSSTAGAIWGLCEYPEQFAKVKADPSLIPGLVDESIRWVTPVKHFMRSATADYQLRGRTIREGDWLWLAYPSGNRDEEVFDDPNAFRIDRNPNRHLAFGLGNHRCIGSNIARLNFRISLEELLRRLDPFRLQVGFVPKRAPGQLWELTSLPLEFPPGSREHATDDSDVTRLDGSGHPGVGRVS